MTNAAPQEEQSTSSRSIAAWLVFNPWKLVAVATVMVLVAGFGARYLVVSVDYRDFFSPNNPELTAYETMLENYSKSDNIFIVVEPRDGRVFTEDTLSALNAITEAAWQLPYSLRVDSLNNFQHTYADQDDLIVEALIEDPKLLLPGDYERIKSIALAEPILVDRLIDPNANVTAVNVVFELPGKHLNEIPEVAAATRALAERIEKQYPGITIHLTGLVMLNNAYAEASRTDLTTLVPLMLLMVFTLLGFMLRSVSLSIAAVIVTIMSIASAMGVAGWLGIKITTILIVAPTIIMTIAVGHCIHVLVTFLQQMESAASKREALLESLRINLQPLTITALTTIVGFLAMNFSDVPPFHDLGNVVAVGVAAAYFFSISVLPAIIVKLPFRYNSKKRQSRRFMNALANFVIARHLSILIIGTIVAIGLVALIPTNETNEKFVEQFDESLEFRQATDFLLENLTGVYTIEYSLDTGETGGISDPEFLQTLEDFSIWLKTLEEVKHINSLTDTLKRLNMNMHADEPGWYKLPEQRDLAAQYLFIYENSLPYNLDLANQVNIDKSATRVIVTFENLKTERLLELQKEIKYWWHTHDESVGMVDASTTLMFGHIVYRAVTSMVTGTAGALTVISLILIIALRSVKIGLVSLIPNLVPLALATGVWAILRGEVGMSLSIVMAMTLGIVVDDTVHFLSKYIRARKENGYSAAEAIIYSYQTVGSALWYTSLALIAGFLVLSLSMFSRNGDMGLLTAITIIAALVADFLFLPALLIVLDKAKGFKSDRNAQKLTHEKETDTGRVSI